MVKRKRSHDHLRPRKVEDLSDSVASFFRIIMPSVLIENKLVLPKKFCEKYGDELSKVVRLIVPAGGAWKVGLEKFGDVLLLCDGWQKFMDHHSILSGHFLTFNYKGNSEFNVNVFDLTATEIQYPSNGNSEMPWYNKDGMVSQEEEFYDGSEVAEGEDDDDDDGDDASTAILTSSTRFRSSNSDASTEHLHQVRKRRTREVSPINLSCQSSHNTEKHGLESSKDLNQETCSKRHKSSSGDCSRRQTYIVRERERALIAAKLYKTVNPLFILPLNTYNVQRSYLVHVPAKFAREYMQPCPEVIELQDSDNKRWPVHCLTRGGKVITLSKGWSEFVKKEKLHAGDVCVFELIETNGAVLKVTVFRSTKC